MKYALTYSVAGDFETTDTIIVETYMQPDEAGQRWYNLPAKVIAVLKDYGEPHAEEIVRRGGWYIRNVDDVDIYLEDEDDEN